jgi:hypothetical protein
VSNITTNYLNPRTGWFEQAQGAAGVMLVEESNAAFRQGRQYFAFHEFSVLGNSSAAIKVVIASDTIMRDFFVDTVSSTMSVEIVSGGTEGGTFNVPVPIFPTNNMSSTPVRPTTSVFTAGGTLTGGTTLDKFLLYAGNNINQSTRQHGGEAFPVGFPAGTYYVRLTTLVNTTGIGIFKARWSEDA